MYMFDDIIIRSFYIKLPALRTQYGSFGTPSFSSAGHSTRAELYACVVVVVVVIVSL